MKSKQEKRQEAIKRQEEYEKLTPKQKLLRLDLQVGDKGADKQRAKLKDLEISTSQLPVGVGDSVNKEKKKPYQKPKKS